MVVSNEVYSPQAFLEKATGRTYFFDSSIDNDKDFIIDVLMSTKGGFYIQREELTRDQICFELADTSLFEDYNVVLVQCSCYNEVTESYELKHYWFVVDGSLDW